MRKVKLKNKDITTSEPVTVSEPLNNPERRTVLKTGLALGPAAVIVGSGVAGTVFAQTFDTAFGPGGVVSDSPKTDPFLEAMPIIPELPQRPLSDPAFALAPTTAPNRAINPATGIPYEGRGDAHQHRNLNEPQFFYAQRIGPVPAASIHPQLQPQVNLWGGNLGGADLNVDKPTTPMPTIVSRYKAGSNTAILVRRFNNLPKGAPSGGFGKYSISTHLHNFHSAPDSDGGPCDPTLGSLSEDPKTQGRFYFPGQYYDYYYNMKRAGFTNPATPDGDVRETLGTLWYHDHREAHTAENVYKGLAGFHILFNEYDTGSEATGFKLPSYPAYDIPTIFADIRIDPATSQLAFDLLERNGLLGDKYLVNGKVQPFYNVNKRRYRMRLLNMGPSRFHQIFLTNPDNLSQSIPFWMIANDGNLLPKPLSLTSVKLSVAERADIIIDFNKLTAAGGAAAGATRLWLENRLNQTRGEGPDSTLAAAGNPKNVLVEYRIGAVVADASVDPATITSFAPITLPPIEKPRITRTFRFDRNRDNWTVNGTPINCDEIRFTMKRGTTEVWKISGGGPWAHPIHNHFVEGRIIKRNGSSIPASSPENSRKDVLWLDANQTIEYSVKVTDYVGVYPLHCHNVVHEDHAMMLLFRVDDVGDTKTTP